MSNKECSIKKPSSLGNNNVCEESSSKHINNKNKNLTTTTIGKDDRTIFLEGGNYVGFQSKNKRRTSINSIDTGNDGINEGTNSSDKVLNCKKNTNWENSPRKRSSSSNRNKKLITRSKKPSGKKRKKSNRLKHKSYCVTDSMECEIESQPYYHGLRPLEDFEHFFMNAGDFLVYLSPMEDELKYYLAVMNIEKKIEFFPIENDNGRYYLGLMKKNCKNFGYFKSIPVLIDYYKKSYIRDRDKLFLKCKLKRPSNYIEHSSFTYDNKNDILGQGNFATVYKGVFFENDCKEMNIAAKVFSPWNENETFEEKTERVLKILSEAKTMKHLDNDYIVSLYGIAVNKLPICIIMELCSGGSLENHLKIEKDKICVGERLFYCYDILNGACYLASHNIVHRDLAARNILISDDGFLKIGDFGQAIHSNDQNFHSIKNKSKVISLWSPPECLSSDSTAWSEKSDVWSFGIVAIEIFNNGQPPFKKEDAAGVVSQLKKGVYFEIPKLCHEDWTLVLKEGIFIKEQRSRFDFKQLRELLKALLTHNVNLQLPSQDSIALNRRGVRRIEFKILDSKKHSSNNTKN
uniref:non-specific protein-tyrosine kinase n=2 Tax=Strongyloides stercoralis TaxID=6248 RepID=A0A0K0EKF5_STRER